MVSGTVTRYCASHWDYLPHLRPRAVRRRTTGVPINWSVPNYWSGPPLASRTLHACLTPPRGVFALATSNGDPRPWKARRGREDPDRFRAPRGVLQVLKSPKKITKRQRHVQNGSSAPLYLPAAAKNNKAWHMWSSLSMYSQQFAVAVSLAHWLPAVAVAFSHQRNSLAVHCSEVQHGLCL